MRRFVGFLFFASAIAVSSAAPAQDYPNKPIHVLTTSSAGGISDIFMRVLGEELHKSLGQPLIIENRPGGAGNIAARACTEAAARRLHDLHHQCRRDDLQPVPLQEPAVRSGEGHADHQPVPPDPGAGDQFRSQGQDGR